MNLALFDFDGTITAGDTWTPFMRFAVRPARIVAWLPFIPVVAAYRIGFVSASRVRQLAARVGFQGEDAARVRRLGAEYAAGVLPNTMRPAAMERIAWHKLHGHHIAIVSASLGVYLEPWCEAQGLDCICATLEERDGRLTGRYVHGDCVGVEKVRRIRERYDLSRYALIYAYGDTSEDREMLALAHEKYYRWKDISEAPGVCVD